MPNIVITLTNTNSRFRFILVPSPFRFRFILVPSPFLGISTLGLTSIARSWSPGGAPGGNTGTSAHRAATVARAGANAPAGVHITSWGGHWSASGPPGGSARASAHRAATVARAGANARPGAEGSGPGLPTFEQQGVAGIDRQQSTERHH